MEYQRYKKVLFCTDFSENSDYAFEFALGIAKIGGGLLYILHVIPANPHLALCGKYITREDSEKIQIGIVEEDLDIKYREHYVKRMENGIKFEIVTKIGREDEEIIKFAEREKVDLLVLGTHSRTGLEHVFYGSVAENVIRRSPFPVFVIPSRRMLERSEGV
ncbi:MAG: universal stress protein [Proteobacteria bacterium]|nr:universal stress protein [Pseudomonadota bacterium]